MEETASPTLIRHNDTYQLTRNLVTNPARISANRGVCFLEVYLEVVGTILGSCTGLKVRRENVFRIKDSFNRFHDRKISSPNAPRSK